MSRDPRAYLWDVCQAADAILDFAGRMEVDAYCAAPMVQAAVERKFEIIGEALNALSRTHPDLAARVPELANIVAFRNILIHGYAVVDQRRVWCIVRESLPGLRTHVRFLLDELNSP
jgi:uncharacterized protein with HEPN domain